MPVEGTMLDSEITDRERKLGELEEEVSRLKPRYEYMQSGTFANDLIAGMLAGSLGTEPRPPHGIPEALQKYQQMKVFSVMRRGSNQAYLGSKSDLLIRKPIHVSIADGNF